MRWQCFPSGPSRWSLHRSARCVLLFLSLASSSSHHSVRVRPSGPARSGSLMMSRDLMHYWSQSMAVKWKMFLRTEQIISFSFNKRIFLLWINSVLSFTSSPGSDGPGRQTLCSKLLHRHWCFHSEAAWKRNCFFYHNRSFSKGCLLKLFLRWNALLHTICIFTSEGRNIFVCSSRAVEQQSSRRHNGSIKTALTGLNAFWTMFVCWSL